ncbi:hypothetical protein TNCV_4342911 [Trichonephila clavipes]|nr:hypothetical protein TNCV_4342911 [Trichonephila clavipes]
MASVSSLPPTPLSEQVSGSNASQNVGVFVLVQHMQLLPWPAYSHGMSPIEHVWDLVGWSASHSGSESYSFKR